MRNLIGKHVYTVTNSESQSSQQVAFVDGGERTTFTNRKHPKICSVMATSVASMALVADGRKSFTRSTACDRYKNRPAEQHSLNLFHFVYHHWSATETTTPPIFGYYDVTT